MNSKIDVLAVMDCRIADCDTNRLSDSSFGALDALWETQQAREAVAELIEAAQAMRLEASRLRGDCIPADTLADFDAALTRMTGA